MGCCRRSLQVRRYHPSALAAQAKARATKQAAALLSAKAKATTKPQPPCHYVEAEGDYLGFQIKGGKLWAFPGPHGPMDVQVLASNCGPGKGESFKDVVGSLLAQQLLPKLDQMTKGQRFTLGLIKIQLSNA